jgi:hypothetical protein
MGTPTAALRVDPKGALAARLRHCLAAETGAIAVIVALMAPMLVGAMGLGSEAGYWYLTQRRLQNAADVAAYAVAQRRTAGDEASAQRIADYLVENSDVTPFGDVTVQVVSPPTAGAFAGAATAVEIVITQSVPRFLSAIYTADPIEISARAVAVVGTPVGTGCVLALNKSASGAITVTGSSDIDLDGCDMVANSSAAGAFMRQGNGNSASVNCIQTVGTAQASGVSMACDGAREGADPVADPFAGIPEPAAVGACQDGSVGKPNNTTSLTPVENHSSGMKSMRFCNGLDLKGTLNLDPGLYIVEGGTFRINSNASISGEGVVFFLADDVDMHFNGTATIDLSAPTEGLYAGILIFSSRDSTESHTINGNAATALDGAIYAAAAHIQISGNSSTSAGSCTQIIGDTITFSGNGSVRMNCAAPAGATISIGGTPVALVE